MEPPINLEQPIKPHRRVLTDEQLAEYQARGFLTLRNVFDADLLQRLTQTTDRLWDRGRSMTQKTAHFDLAEGHRTKAGTP